MADNSRIKRNDRRRVETLGQLDSIMTFGVDLEDFLTIEEATHLLRLALAEANRLSVLLADVGQIARQR